MAAFAISAALFQRERTGRSQHIDVSMLDVALTMMSSILTASAWSGRDPVAPGNGHALSGNCAFPAEEGMIMLGANDCKQHKLLFELLDEPGIAARNDWNSRLDHSAEEKQVLAERVQARPAQEDRKSPRPN